MDPVSVGLLAALAGGIGGEVGRQSWASLSALVRRPFTRSDIRSGEDELAALEENPGDTDRARALGMVLTARADADTAFRTALESWVEQARLIRTGDGEVHNEISGGAQYGPVVQARDISGGLTFTSPPPSSAGPER